MDCTISIQRKDKKVVKMPCNKKRKLELIKTGIINPTDLSEEEKIQLILEDEKQQKELNKKIKKLYARPTYMDRSKFKRIF